MTRSDLPHLAALPFKEQQKLADAVWAAWWKAEWRSLGTASQVKERVLRPNAGHATPPIPVSRKATVAELVEAVLAAQAEMNRPVVHRHTAEEWAET